MRHIFWYSLLLTVVEYARDYLYIGIGGVSMESRVLRMEVSYVLRNNHLA
jgi:hypothetical protein